MGAPYLHWPAPDRLMALQALLNSGLDGKADAEMINSIGQIMGQLQMEKVEGRGN